MTPIVRLVFSLMVGIFITFSSSIGFVSATWKIIEWVVTHPYLPAEQFSVPEMLILVSGMSLGGMILGLAYMTYVMIKQ